MSTSSLSAEVPKRFQSFPFSSSRLSDFDILRRAQCGDNNATEFVLRKYRNLVRAKIRSYYLVGGESDDLYQIGMIGLWQAIVDFRNDPAMSFAAFAKMCVTHHLLSAIKAATRQKQMLLNASISLNGFVGKDHYENTIFTTSYYESVKQPEDVILEREDYELLTEEIKRTLSDFEWDVISRYRVGQSYREIANEIGCNTKCVDNALARIKRKVSKLRLFDRAFLDKELPPTV